MIVAKYKFNPSTYADLLPIFNNGYTSYTKSDITNSDGTITRTIESSALPTSMRFGETTNVSDRSNSLLEVLDMNTSNLTNMYCMFKFCTNLTSVSCTWNTSQVIDIAAMFMNCSSLTTLDVSKWNTSKVTNMATLFHGCKALTSLDISNWNTSQVTSMFSMFTNCSSLTSLDVSKWNVSQVTIMSNIFHTCSSLTSLDVSNWNTSKATDMMGVFQNCSSLTSLDVSNWNTSKVTHMGNMFNGCSSLVSLDIINLNTSKVTAMNFMFQGCSSLTSLDLSNWDTSRVTNMSYMFRSCSSLTSLDISNLNTSKVTAMSNMFSNCNKLTSLDLNNWDTSKVTDMSAMFGKCSSLTQLDVSNLDTSKVTNMAGIFQNCTSLTSLDISNWNTSRVTSMQEMFYYCTSLTQLDLSNWNTSKVTHMGSMFSRCSSLTSLDLSNWNTSKVTHMSSMFYYGSSLHKINLKYANQSTVSKIHENLLDRSSTTKGYILSSVDLTSDKNWQIIKSSHNEFYLPQPLRKVGDVKDRLYWDENKGHYCMEQHFIKVVFDGSDDEDWKEHYLDGNEDKSRHCYYPLNVSVYPKFATTDNVVLCDKLTWRHAHNWGTKGVPIEDEFLINTNEFCVFKSSISTVSEFKEWISQNPITLIHPLETPIIIDLPEMNKKFSFDTYLPNTYVDVTNLPLQPYKLQLEDDTVRYKSTIEPSTLYTIQFNCITKSTTLLTLDLGGTRKTVDPTIGVNHVQITTPSELTSDRLFLIGTGIIINEVIVNKGDMNQYPKYFDGEQSVGELQEDGSYIIRISTDNYTNLWEGDL